MKFYAHIIAPADAYSTGECKMLVRNATTGKFEIVDMPVMGMPNLQQVTDVGPTTTKSMSVTGGVGGAQSVMTPNDFRLTGVASGGVAKGYTQYDAAGTTKVAEWGFFSGTTSGVTSLNYAYMGVGSTASLHSGAALKVTSSTVGIGLSGATVPNSSYVLDVVGASKFQSAGATIPIEVIKTGSDPNQLQRWSRGVYTDGYLEIASSASANFAPAIRAFNSSVNGSGLYMQAWGQNDFGTGSAFVLRGANAAYTGGITGGNLFTLQNYTATTTYIDYAGFLLNTNNIHRQRSVNGTSSVPVYEDAFSYGGYTAGVSDYRAKIKGFNSFGSNAGVGWSFWTHNTGLTVEQETMRMNVDGTVLVPNRMTIGSLTAPTSILDVYGVTGTTAPIVKLGVEGAGGLEFGNNSITPGTYIPAVTGTSTGSGGAATAIYFIGKGYDDYAGTATFMFSAKNAAGTGAHTGGSSFRILNHLTPLFDVLYDGKVTISNLAGTGTRMVTTDLNGVIGSAAMPPTYTSSTSITISGTTFVRAALTGDVTAASNSNTTTIAANAVSNTKLRDSAGLSVIGRSANTTGDPADIVAATDGFVLRRSGTTLGFGKIGNDSVDDNSLALSKLVTAGAATLVGNPDSMAGSHQDLGVGYGLGFIGGTTLGVLNHFKVYTQVHAASISLPPNSTTPIVFGSVGGVTVGEFLQAIPLAAIADRRVDIKARCTVAGQIHVYIHNNESATVTIPASQPWKFTSLIEV